MTDETFVVKQVSKNTYEVAKFGDDSRVVGTKDASVSLVSVYPNNIHCDCIGYRRQKVKEDHKHCKIVKFAINVLEDTTGYCFWFEDGLIKYNKFYDYQNDILYDKFLDWEKLNGIL